MLFDIYINHMNEDELRNYAHHQNEIEEKYHMLNCVKQDMIDILQRACRIQSEKYECEKQLFYCKEGFSNFEKEIREKYEEYNDRPINSPQYMERRMYES